MRAGNVTEPGSDQHQGGVAVRKGSDHIGPSTNLPHDPFQGVIGSDPAPVGTWESTVGERFLGFFLDLARSVGFPVK